MVEAVKVQVIVALKTQEVKAVDKAEANKQARQTQALQVAEARLQVLQAEVPLAETRPLKAKVKNREALLKGRAKF